MQTTTWMDTQEKSKKRRNSAFKLHLLGNANSYQNPFTKKTRYAAYFNKTNHNKN